MLSTITSSGFVCWLFKNTLRGEIIHMAVYVCVWWWLRYIMYAQLSSSSREIHDMVISIVITSKKTSIRIKIVFFCRGAMEYTAGLVCTLKGMKTCHITPQEVTVLGINILWYGFLYLLAYWYPRNIHLHYNNMYIYFRHEYIRMSEHAPFGDFVKIRYDMSKMVIKRVTKRAHIILTH